MIKHTFSIIGVLFFAVLITKCSSSQTDDTNEEIVGVISEDDNKELLQVGDSIAAIAQQTLMKNVSSAMQKGGSEYAVDYCNLHAMSLTDSISSVYHVEIKRLSDKNRNPENAISSDLDQKAWNKISEMFEDNEIIDKHLVLNENGEHYYYKAIPLGMTTCLNCHGQGDEVSNGVRKILHNRYPSDKALGYVMGELRGMWKIKITEI